MLHAYLLHAAASSGSAAEIGTSFTSSTIVGLLDTGFDHEEEEHHRLGIVPCWSQQQGHICNQPVESLPQVM
jgi:hypothetical protein